jgi:hypothetical protein
MLSRRSPRIIASTNATDAPNIYESYRTTSAMALPTTKQRRQRAPKRVREETPLVPAEPEKVAAAVPAAAEPEPITNRWSFYPQRKGGVVSHILPPGTYYIGDICYALSKDVYNDVFGGFDYQAGIYQQKKKSGRIFLVNRTRYGDGEFSCSYTKKKFLVDSGTIGICSKALIQNGCKGGHVHTFRHHVHCYLSQGVFVFSSDDDDDDCIEIDTR